jgi:hypothetical protein
MPTNSKRERSKLEIWTKRVIFLTAVLGIIGTLLTLKDRIMVGKVQLTIASARDDFGRCIDRELFIINNTKTNASDIVISFDVDYLTRQGVVGLNYGDEDEELITSAVKTLLPRKPFVRVEHRMDDQDSKLTIPELKPGEYLHIYFGGETIKDNERDAVRRELLKKGERALMNKPRVATASHKTGPVDITRRDGECKQ